MKGNLVHIFITRDGAYGSRAASRRNRRRVGRELATVTSDCNSISSQRVALTATLIAVKAGAFVRVDTMEGVLLGSTQFFLNALPLGRQPFAFAPSATRIFRLR